MLSSRTFFMTLGLAAAFLLVRLIDDGARSQVRERHIRPLIHTIESAAPGMLTPQQIHPADVALAGKVRRLINSGINPNVRGRGDYLCFNRRPEYSPLHVACARTLPITVKTLLELGADPKFPDSHGNTPLTWTIHHTGDTHVMRLLFQAGADPNARDATGQTPLMLAMQTRWSDEKVARCLLQAGADVNARDNSGKTARAYAWSGMLGTIDDMFRRAGETFPDQPASVAKRDGG